MKRAIIIAIGLAVLLFGTVFGLHAYQQHRIHKKLAASAGQPVVVSDAPVQTVNHSPEISAVGMVAAVQGSSISSAVGGVVQTIDFHSGMRIRQNQVLLTLNAGALPGKLAQAKADQRLAQTNYQRQRSLYAVRGTSQALYDTAKYKLQSTQAEVTALKQALAQYTIKAPFDGVAGLRKLDAGAYVHPGDTITNLEGLKNLYVDFSVPQNEVRKVRTGAPVTLAIHDGARLVRFTAHVTAINSHVSSESRAISVRALINRPKGLFPGMFTMVTIQSRSPTKVVAVPLVAVSFNTFGDFVYVVRHAKHGNGLIAVEQPVATGAEFGDEVEIVSGIKPGDEVITAGQVKLHNGDPVKINNAMALRNSTKDKS